MIGSLLQILLELNRDKYLQEVHFFHLRTTAWTPTSLTVPNFNCSSILTWHLKSDFPLTWPKVVPKVPWFDYQGYQLKYPESTILKSRNFFPLLISMSVLSYPPPNLWFSSSVYWTPFAFEAFHLHTYPLPPIHFSTYRSFLIFPSMHWLLLVLKWSILPSVDLFIGLDSSTKLFYLIEVLLSAYLHNHEVKIPI